MKTVGCVYSSKPASYKSTRKVSDMAFIYYLTQIQIDFGAVNLLAAECERVGIRRPLIVTDPGVKAVGILQQALDAMPGLPVAVYDQTPSNPTEAAVRAAVAVYHAQGCDGLIAVGGGSAIDCAKGVAIAATHEGPLKTYATIEGGSPKITERVAPLIAVPTTAGTGSEVARGAIIIVDDHRKLGFHSWHLLPKTAICDPGLTLGLPPLLTAATGMDAIAHCMETFMAAPFNPPADGIALDGLARGWAHIERATRDGQDREARLNMMSASMQGAMAFQKGLGCVHSLEPQLGRREPAPAPRHAERPLPARRDPLQRHGRIGAKRAPPGPHGPGHGSGPRRRHPGRHPRAERAPGPAQRPGGRGRD
jgi:4-hydroxybutyrate dehydrogenase